MLAIGCAIVGGLVGYFGFVMLLDQGFYALVLPGGLLGLAAGVVRTRGAVVAVLSAFLAIIAGLLSEYRSAPFVANGSLSYFFLHVSALRPVTLTLVGLGGLIGFWVPFRRRFGEAAKN